MPLSLLFVLALVGPFGAVVGSFVAAAATSQMQCRSSPDAAGGLEVFDDELRSFVFAPARARIGSALVPAGYIAANLAFVFAAHLAHRTGHYAMVSFRAAMVVALLLDLPALVLLRRALAVTLVLDDAGVLICNPLQNARFAWQEIAAIRWGTVTLYERYARFNVPMLEIETNSDPGAEQVGVLGLAAQRSVRRPRATYAPGCEDQQRLVAAVARRAARHSVDFEVSKEPLTGGRTAVVRGTQNLSFTMPESRAGDVRAAIEHWLASRGIATSLRAEAPAEGKVRLTARITGQDAAKLNLGDLVVQDEMQRIVSEALQTGQHPDGSST